MVISIMRDGLQILSQLSKTSFGVNFCGLLRGQDQIEPGPAVPVGMQNYLLLSFKTCSAGVILATGENSKVGRMSVPKELRWFTDKTGYTVSLLSVYR